MKLCFVAFMILPLILSIPAAIAQPNTQQISALNACTKIASDLRRLICYDEAMGIAESENDTNANAEQTKKREDLVIATKQQSLIAQPLVDKANAQPDTSHLNDASDSAKEIERQVSDFGAEALKERAKPLVSKINSTIVNIVEGPREARTFTLENGQRWRESTRERVRFKEGQPVFIEKGALTSFYMGRDGTNRRIRVKRIE